MCESGVCARVNGMYRASIPSKWFTYPYPNGRLLAFVDNHVFIVVE